MRLEGLEAALLARGPGSTAGASAGASAGPSGSASPAASPEPRRGRPHAESALPAAPLQAYTQSHALAVPGVFRAHLPGQFSTALAMHGIVEGSCMLRVEEICMQTSAGRPCRAQQRAVAGAPLLRATERSAAKPGLENSSGAAHAEQSSSRVLQAQGLPGPAAAAAAAAAAATAATAAAVVSVSTKAEPEQMPPDRKKLEALQT